MGAVDEFITATLASGQPPRRQFFEHVPVIDLAALPIEDVPDAIGAACTQPGFFYLKGHGVAQAHIDSVFGNMEAFFSLPLETKMLIAMRDQSNRRGFSPVNEKATDKGSGADHKESLDFGAEGTDFSLGGENPWPEKPAPLRASIERLQSDLVKLANQLLGYFATALKIDPQYFLSRSRQSIARTKLLHYPPAPVGEARVGVGTHTDYGVLTLLIQHGVPGLQLQNADGSWLDVAPERDAILVNLGDQMAHWTNDIFQATPHRVDNRSGRERYSIAYFFHPDHDADISPLEICRSEAYRARYGRATAGQHLVASYRSPDSAYNYDRSSVGG